MPYTYDDTNHKITIPQGDTTTLYLNVSGGGIVEGSLVLFKVKNLNWNQWVVKKSATVSDGRAEIRIENADTRDLLPRFRYGWTLGLVFGADIAPDGTVTAEDSTDGVVSVFNGLAEFVVTDSGVMDGGGI